MFKLKKSVLFAVLFIAALSFTVMPSFAAGNFYWTSASKIGIASFHYSEPLDYDTGINYSLIQRFDYHNNLLFATLRGEVGYTPANYNGSYSDGTPLTANVDYKDWSALGGIGIDPRIMNGLMQNQIYVSLSENNMTWMAGSISGGYDENYNVKYLGLNYRNIYAITPRLSTVVGLSYYKGIDGQVLATNYPFYTNAPAMTVGQALGGEWAYALKVGARYRINNNLSLVADLVYSHMFFNQSSTNYYDTSSGYYGIQEPSSNTYTEGLELGVHYAF